MTRALREKLGHRFVGREDDFRWRGGEVSRIVHAYRLRKQLELNALELFDTKTNIVAHLLAIGVALTSITVALTVPTRLVGLAGYTYFLFGPVMAIHGSTSGRMRRRHETAAP